MILKKNNDKVSNNKIIKWNRDVFTFNIIN